ACVIGQSPNVFGTLTDMSAVAEAAHAKKALFVSVFTEAVSLGLVTPPGEMGADIAVGEGQSIGNSLNFGGPYVGLFACTQKLVRQMPGRLCGQTVDADGARGFVLTLSTREQHIRRDKATSNICTNSGLCALAFTAHMTLLGGKGLEELAVLNHEMACDLVDALAEVPGVEILTPRYFNEFAFRTQVDAEAVLAMLGERGVLGGVRASRLLPCGSMGDVIIAAATECTTQDDIAAYAQALKEIV
ncbi:MAG: glycine dehydrogenase, partial [Pseudomonadota bacterium]